MHGFHLGGTVFEALLKEELFFFLNNFCDVLTIDRSAGAPTRSTTIATISFIAFKADKFCVKSSLIENELNKNSNNYCALIFKIKVIIVGDPAG